MSVVPFDPFVIALVRLHPSVERICRVVFRRTDLTITIYLWSGGNCGEELRLFLGEEETLRARADVEGIEFVERVVMQLFRHVGSREDDIERSDVEDEEGVPEAVRRTTSWFPKRCS